MRIEIGQIEAIFRHPVKSMRGQALDSAQLGWHGLDGDRRFALRRIGVPGNFPWLTASKLPALIHFTPEIAEDGALRVRTPEGETLSGEALDAEISRRYGAPLEMMQLKHGIFDEGALSVITSHTAAEICRLAGTRPDLRRFRPNVVVRSLKKIAFEEDEWVGGVLRFGAVEDAPAIAVTLRDERCVMVNFDPDGGPAAPEMMKVVVRENQNHAGIYGAVTRVGRLEIGQTVTLER